MTDTHQESISFSPIGVIYTPFKSLDEMPIQPTGKASAPGTAEIYPEYRIALADLDRFSHVILIYHFHRVESWKPKVTPFLDTIQRGLFATRAPARPNPIGLSIVRLERIQSGVIYLGNVDILDGTPLLDIKPYVPTFDQPQDPVKIGWLADSTRDVQDMQSDDRFTN
jgi:tRNA-Thr(GGU) m(6)t(6)A37 methyltransferase TsaA